MFKNDITKEQNPTSLQDAVSFENANAQPIVVIGSGPAGAISALGAARKGYQVLVVTKYSYATRQQRIRLDSRAIKSLKEYQDSSDADRQFFAKLKENKNTLSIKSLENFLIRKLREEAQRNSKLKLIDQTIAELDNVDLQKSPPTISLKSSKDHPQETVEIEFRHLVDASGSRRIAYKLAQGDAKVVEQKLDADHQPKHAAQGTAIIHLNDYAKKKLNTRWGARVWRLFHPGNVHRVRFSNKDLAELQRLEFSGDQGEKLAVTFNNKPNIYVIAATEKQKKGQHSSAMSINDDAVSSHRMLGKFYVGGDVPEVILNINDQEKRQAAIGQWCQYVLAIHLRELGIKQEDLYRKYDDINKEDSDQRSKEKFMQIFSNDSKLTEQAVQSKRAMNVTGFNLSISRVQNPICDINNDNQHFLFAVGESLQNAHFHYGHGAIDAMRQAASFVDCLTEHAAINRHRCFQVEDYQKQVNQLIQEHDQRLASAGKLVQRVREKIWPRNKFSFNFKKKSATPPRNTHPSVFMSKK